MEAGPDVSGFSGHRLLFRERDLHPLIFLAAIPEGSGARDLGNPGRSKKGLMLTRDTETEADGPGLPRLADGPGFPNPGPFFNRGILSRVSRESDSRLIANIPFH